MYAKDLIKILEKLPPDTIICKTSGDHCCDDLESAKYFPQYNILYLDPYWKRISKGFIDMGRGYKLPEILKGEDYSKEELREIRDLAKKGKEIVDAKNDGRMHSIQVIFTKREDFQTSGKCFSLVVDGEWLGGCIAPMDGTVVCDFKWESLGDGAKSEKP